METEKDIQLRQIADHLIINSSFLKNLGLFHGKMGIVLFFMHYAQYTGNAIYEEYAGDLLDEIFEDIHAGLTLDFENGLSGIGWGFLYLLKNHFVEGDPDEVLSEIDQRMMEINLSRVVDKSVECGLGGYLYYLSERLSVGSENFLFDMSYRTELQKILITLQLDKPFDLYSLIAQNMLCSITDVAKDSLGICGGYAGIGFKLMRI